MKNAVSSRIAKFAFKIAKTVIHVLSACEFVREVAKFSYEVIIWVTS